MGKASANALPGTGQIRGFSRLRDFKFSYTTLS